MSNEALAAGAGAGLDALFDPQSIALIGASSDLRRIGGRPMRFLRQLGYQGRVYPVNPKYGELHGWRCFPDVEALPEAPDLVIVAVPADQVLPAVESCARAGARSALILSAGFAETGPAGALLQRRLAELARSTGLRICGPNCIGLVNVHRGVGATFTTALDGRRVEPGSIGLVSQSGALGAYFFAVAQAAGVKFSSWITTGNEADVEVAECIEYFVGDPNTHIIAAWAEGIRDGRRLARAAEAARQAGKPLLLVKAGRSSDGRRAAASHTAVLATDDRIVDAFCQQFGVERAADLQALRDGVLACTSQRRPAGPGVGIVGLSGGAGVMLADECARQGLVVPELAPERVERLKAMLPWFGSPRNPLDCTAQIVNDPSLYRASLSILAEDEAVQSLVVFMGLQPEIAERIAGDTVEVARSTDKPIFVTWMLTPPPARRILEAAGIPLYQDPNRCVAALGVLVRQTEARRRPPRILEPETGPVAAELHELRRAVAEQGGEVRWSEPRTKALLRAYGLPVTREIVVDSAQAAVEQAAQLGFPVVLKLAAAELVHKSGLGLVRVGLRSESEVRQAAVELLAFGAGRPELGVEGLLVQEQVPDGFELLLGLRLDPAFGPVVSLGSGGPRAELYGDVSLRLPPLEPADVPRMLSELRCGALFNSANPPRWDLPALSGAVLAFARLAIDLADLDVELDINPLFIRELGKGVLAADAALIARPAGRRAPND